MRKHVSSRNAAFFAAGGFMAALFMGGAAHAITDTIFKYSTPKTGYLTLSPAAFTPYGIADTNPFINNGFTVNPTTSTGQCFTAPVNIPTGAAMTEATIWYKKGASDSVTMTFGRQKLSDGTFAAIVDKIPASTGGARSSATYSITNAALQTVDNAHYSYSFNVCLANSTAPTLYSARITYTYTNAGD